MSNAIAKNVVKIATCGVLICVLLFSAWVGICWTWPWCALAPDSFPAWVPEEWGPNAQQKPAYIQDGLKMYASHERIDGKKYTFYSNSPFYGRHIHGEQSVVGGKIVMEEATVDAEWGVLRLYFKTIGVERSKSGHRGVSIREEREGGVNGLTDWSTWDKETGENEKSFLIGFWNPPLSARKITMRFHANDDEFADVAFNNKLRCIPRRWKTETLPATRILDPLKVELLKVETEILPRDARPGALPDNSRIEFRLTDARDDQPMVKWRFLHCDFSPSPSVDFRRVSGLFIERVKPSEEASDIFVGENCTTLWNSSGPWKLRMKFVRDNDFQPDEIFEVSNVTLPDDEQIIMDEREWQAAGRKVRLVGVAGKKVDEAAWQRWVGDAFRIQFKSDDSQNWWLRLIAVADEQGNVLWEPSPAEGLSWRGFFFLPPQNRRNMQLPKKVTLKVGVVWESRDAEFTVNPTRPVAVSP